MVSIRVRHLHVASKIETHEMRSRMDFGHQQVDIRGVDQHVTVEVAQQRAYDDELQRCGRDPKDFSLAQLRWVYVAESREKAWDEVGEHMHYLFASAFPLLKAAGDLRADRAMSQVPSIEELRNIDPTIPGGAPIVGTPDDCIQAIQRYQDETRVTHLAMGMHLPGLALEKVTGCLELFAKEVMPHFH